MSGWKKETAEKASEQTTEQFKFQKELIESREQERNYAMQNMNQLLNSAPQYQIPAQVQQYTNLMNTLGAQLYGLQDASGGAKSIDASQYASQTTQVPVFDSKYERPRHAEGNPYVARPPQAEEPRGGAMGSIYNMLDIVSKQLNSGEEEAKKNARSRRS